MNKIKFKNFSNLNNTEIATYKAAVLDAFPAIILNSESIFQKWEKIEKYFPSYQLFAFHNNGTLIGFANTIPFQWNQNKNDLPNDGWDWMVNKGIKDFESNNKTNSLGGLQIVVTKEYLGKGYSKVLISKAKELKEEKKYKNLFIPIRPTLKQNYAQMPMNEYIEFKKDEKIYDPWIRTHLKCGASIIKVCENSMNVQGNIQFWENIYQNKIDQSGDLIIDGALHPVKIDIQNNSGEYREPNIWISY